MGTRGEWPEGRWYSISANAFCIIKKFIIRYVTLVFGKVCSWGSKQIFAGISEKSQIRRDGLVEIFYDVAEVEYLGMVGLMSSYYIP